MYIYSLTKIAMTYITTGLFLIDVYLTIIFHNYCAIMGSYSFCRKEDQLTFLVLSVGFVHTHCVLFFFYYNGYIIMWPVWQYCVFLLEKTRYDFVTQSESQPPLKIIVNDTIKITALWQ